MKKLVTILLSLLIVLSFTACTNKQNNDDGPHVIKIGYVENLTGKSSNSGSLCKRGIDLAHELNNKINIKGVEYDVELVVVDAKSDKVESANCASRVIEQEKVVAVLGPSNSGTNMAMTEIVEEAKIPAICGTATNPLVTQGYKYNFTAIGECGFATAVDSLLAVKEFVFDRKELSLAELGRILAANWEGHEELRLRMKRSRLKWGCGDPEADALAREVIEGFTSRFVGKPNSRGGVFVCYGLNSRGFIRGGEITGATPDGRKAGDFFSKNMAPSVGAETEGITGSIRSYGAIAPENFPCGSIYDVMIHPSTVSGEKGLKVFRMLVERFFAGGGVALNVNIVSSETLRDAQAHPEKYENLQVRVAGWNVRWNDIPRKEQDEYIARIETVGA